MGRGRRGSNKRGGFKNHGSRKKPNQGHGSGGKFRNKRSFNKEDDKNASEGKRQKLEPVEETIPADEESSSSESEEEVKPYTQLLSMFKTSSKAQQVLTSEEESDDTDDEETLDQNPKVGSADEVDDSNLDEEEEENSDNESEEDDYSDDEEQEDYSSDEEGQEDDSDDGGEESDEDKSKVSERKTKAIEEVLEEEPEEEISDGEVEKEELSSDQFCLHYERELSENLLEVLTSPKPYETQELKWKSLGRMVVSLPCKADPTPVKPKLILGETVEKHVTPGSLPVLKYGIPLKDYGVRLQLCSNLDKRPLSDDASTQLAEELLSPLQHELFTLANEYRDVYYPEQTHLNTDEIQTVYCLHALNHVMKSRDKVLYHNAKLKMARENGAAMGEIEYRDQGLVRPRVLIIAPLRNTAVK